VAVCDDAYTIRMTTPIATRLDASDIEMLDRLVADGIGANRSAVIRIALAQLDDAVRRGRIGAEIAESYRTLPESDDEFVWAVANAGAITEEETW
jgi:Arc/MetJ-type ribon-helix-helix transcriptional regulator